MPVDPVQRLEAVQWLVWQVGNFGPILGQLQKITGMDNLSTEGKDYFIQQAGRLYKLLDQRLLIREFIAGEYSVADMAIYPWTVPHERQYQQLSDYPNLMCWYFDIEERPTVEKAYDIPVSLSMPL